MPSVGPPPILIMPLIGTCAVGRARRNRIADAGVAAGIQLIALRWRKEKGAAIAPKAEHDIERGVGVFRRRNGERATLACICGHGVSAQVDFPGCRYR